MVGALSNGFENKTLISTAQHSKKMNSNRLNTVNCSKRLIKRDLWTDENKIYLVYEKKFRINQTAIWVYSFNA